MLPRPDILNLIPHSGASFLLDHVVSWSDGAILCGARSHLDERNPLRRAGRLGAVAGIEYGLQAAALHGALKDGRNPQAVGYVASLRGVELRVPTLDDPEWGVLQVEADVEGGDAGGTLYSFRVFSEARQSLLSGRATIVFPKAAGAPA